MAQTTTLASLQAVALFATVSVFLCVTEGHANAQTGSATGTVDWIVAGDGSELTENRITITRDGNSASGEVVVTVLADFEGPTAGSRCVVESGWTVTATAAITQGQSSWNFSGTLTNYSDLLSADPDPEACGWDHPGPHFENELETGFTANIDGTTMTGFVNGAGFTIPDASVILDQPTPTPAPTAVVTPDDFDFQGDETYDPTPTPPDSECFIETGLRPVIGVVVDRGGSVEVRRDLFEDYGPIGEGDAGAPADPSLVADDSFVLRQGDVLRVRQGYARVHYFEKPIPVALLASEAGTPLEDLGGNFTQIDYLTGSAACIEAAGDPVTGQGTVLDLIRGAIKHVTRGWKNDGIFSVKVGTTVVGIRGTEFMVAYWPEDEDVAVLLHDGEVAVEQPEPETLMPEGSWLLVDEAGAGELWSLSEDDWVTVTQSDDPLEVIGALGRVPYQQPPSPSPSATVTEAGSPAAVEDEDDGGGSGVALAIIVAAVGLLLAGGGGAWLYYLRRSRSEGNGPTA